MCSNFTGSLLWNQVIFGILPVTIFRNLRVIGFLETLFPADSIPSGQFSWTHSYVRDSKCLKWLRNKPYCQENYSLVNWWAHTKTSVWMMNEKMVCMASTPETSVQEGWTQELIHQGWVRKKGINSGNAIPGSTKRHNSKTTEEHLNPETSIKKESKENVALI